MSCRNLLKAVVLCTVLLLSLISYSQDKVITGKVTDTKDGAGVAGVTVSVKGTTKGSSTTADGSFSVSVPASATTLVFSSVGYTTQEVSIEGKTTVNVSLVVNNAALGEIVVVAYGTRRKTDLTGSVTSVSSKDFQKGNINSPEQLLQGKVAGLQITTGGGSAVAAAVSVSAVVLR